MLTGWCVKFGHCGNRWHVRLRTMTRHLILNLKVIEALTLIQGVSITGTSPLSVSDQTWLSAWSNFISTARCREVIVLVLVGVACAILTLLIFLLLLIVVVRVINEALLFEEILPPSISLLGIFLAECIILNVDLALNSVISAKESLLDHCYEPQ